MNMWQKEKKTLFHIISKTIFCPRHGGNWRDTYKNPGAVKGLRELNLLLLHVKLFFGHYFHGMKLIKET